MADTQPTPSKRDKVMERLRTKYPDRNFDDEEELYGTIGDDYDQSDQELERMRGNEKTLTDMFNKNPQSARFLTDMAKGGDPFVGLIRQYGMEIKDILDDPDKQEELAKANAEFVERAARSKELDEQYEQNLQSSLADLEAMQSEEGLSDEDIDKAVGFLVGIFQDLLIGKFSRDSIKMALNALNHDADVATAQEEGEVAGRNTKIKEQLRKPEKSDGLPTIAGQNGRAEEPKKKNPRGIFGVADEAM